NKRGLTGKQDAVAVPLGGVNCAALPAALNATTAVEKEWLPLRGGHQETSAGEGDQAGRCRSGPELVSVEVEAGQAGSGLPVEGFVVEEDAVVSEQEARPHSLHRASPS